MTVSEADVLSSELAAYRATFRDNRVIADQIAGGPAGAILLRVCHNLLS
jgi:hypothetical protein